MRLHHSILLSFLLSNCTVLQPVMAAEPAGPVQAPQVQVIGPLYALGPLPSAATGPRQRSARLRGGYDERGFTYRPWAGGYGWRSDQYRGRSAYAGAGYGYRSWGRAAPDRRRSWYARSNERAPVDWPRYAGRIFTPYGSRYAAPGYGVIYQMPPY